MRDVRARLDWAHRRMEQFNAAVDTFLSTNPYFMSADFECKSEPYYVATHRYRFRVRAPAAVPIDLRLAAGELVHSFRSAIDNIIWTIGKKFKASSRLALEFKNGPDHFAKYTTSAKLSKLPLPLQHWIEAQQLYKRKDGQRSILHDLTILWNEDKHRLPMLAGHAVQCVTIGSRGSVEAVSVGYLVPLNDGDEVVTVTNAVDFEPEFAFGVAFTAIAKEAKTFFQDAERHIAEEVIPTFEPYLT